MKTIINIIITISIIGIIKIDVIDIHVTQIWLHAVSALDTGRLHCVQRTRSNHFLLLIW